MRRDLMVFLILFVWGASWGQVILDVRKLRYRDILPWLVQSNRIFQGILIDTPLKGYHGKFLPTEEVYDFTDVGEIVQRGSRETFLGSREEFDEVVKWCETQRLFLYARVRLFQQSEGFATNFWAKGDFYPDYTVAIDRSTASQKLRQVVNSLRRLPISVWVVDVTGLPVSYQSKASRWVKENFPQALVMADSLKDATFSSLPFSQWLRRILEEGRPLVPEITFSGLYGLTEDSLSSFGAFYYFLLRQKKAPVVISTGALSLCQRMEDISPSLWSDIRWVYTASDHLWGISSRGVVSLYMGEGFRYTNYSINLPSPLKPVFGEVFLKKGINGWEGLFLPGSFSLWVVTHEKM